ESWRAVLAAAARPLRVLRPTGGEAVLATPTVVVEILQVLLDNAHRHGAGAVTVTFQSAGQWLGIDVSDEGPGFPEGGQDPFARRSPSSHGHGIGLALAHALAQAEGGRLAITQRRPPTLTLWLRRPDGNVRLAAEACASTDSAPALEGAPAK